MAGRINGTFSDAAWAPVRYVNRPYSRTALAGLYRTARAGLVTPLRDGMNLVAKEYVAAQDAADPGVLILSRFAGAAVEFKEGAPLVNPYDPDSVAAAIARAIAMPLAERKSRHAALYATLISNDISKWGDRFLSSLMGTKTFDLEAAPKAAQSIAGRHPPGACRINVPMGRRQHAQQRRQRRPQSALWSQFAREYCDRELCSHAGSLASLRQQPEMIDQRQRHHRRRQHQLGAQHRQIERCVGTASPQQNGGGIEHAGQNQHRHRDHAPFGETARWRDQQGALSAAREQHGQHREAADPEAAGEKMQPVADGADGGEMRRAGFGGMAGD